MTEPYWSSDDETDRATGAPLTDAQQAARYRSYVPHLRRALAYERAELDKVRALCDEAREGGATSVSLDLVEADLAMPGLHGGNTATDAVVRVRALCDEAEAKGRALQAIPELKLVGNAYVGMAARTRRALDSTKDVSDGK